MADREPLVIEAPDTEAQPPTAPTTDDVSNTPPSFREQLIAAGVSPVPAKPRRRAKDEFALLGDIQDAIRAMPSNAARSRAWEWITGWMAEEFIQHQPRYPIMENDHLSQVMNTITPMPRPDPTRSSDD